MNIPNYITLLRILAVPLVVWLILEDNLLWAFWVFAFAGVSDALDGYIAKRFNMETELGKYLDPLADKALLVSVFIVLGIAGIIPSWMVILVVFRDVVIVFGAMVFETLTGSLTMAPMKPQMVSKVNTTLQILYAGSVMAEAGFELNLGHKLDLLMICTALTTAASGISIVAEALGRWPATKRGEQD